MVSWIIFFYVWTRQEEQKIMFLFPWIETGRRENSWHIFCFLQVTFYLHSICVVSEKLVNYDDHMWWWYSCIVFFMLKKKTDAPIYKQNAQTKTKNVTEQCAIRTNCCDFRLSTFNHISCALKVSVVIHFNIKVWLAHSISPAHDFESTCSSFSSAPEQPKFKMLCEIKFFFFPSFPGKLNTNVKGFFPANSSNMVQVPAQLWKWMSNIFPPRTTSAASTRRTRQRWELAGLGGCQLFACVTQTKIKTKRGGKK